MNNTDGVSYVSFKAAKWQFGWMVKFEKNNAGRETRWRTVKGKNRARGERWCT